MRKFVNRSSFVVAESVVVESIHSKAPFVTVYLGITNAGGTTFGALQDLQLWDLYIDGHGAMEAISGEQNYSVLDLHKYVWYKGDSLRRRQNRHGLEKCAERCIVVFCTDFSKTEQSLKLGSTFQIKVRNVFFSMRQCIIELSFRLM